MLVVVFGCPNVFIFCIFSSEVARLIASFKVFGSLPRTKLERLGASPIKKVWRANSSTPPIRPARSDFRVTDIVVSVSSRLRCDSILSEKSVTPSFGLCRQLCKSAMI